METVVQLERDPPEIVTSDSTKSVEASERVKVRVDVSPALRAVSYTHLTLPTKRIV